MRHVRKGREPATFRDWKALAGADWEPTWADLRAPEKPDLHAALIEEQGAVCCYCGRRITQGDSHIEHFQPRNGYPDRSLDYTNLLASCQRNEHKGVPRLCGHAKDDWFDETCHLDPQDPECERRFRFGSQGDINANRPADRAAATMVEQLNLNEPFLAELRRQILDGAFPSELLAAASDDELTATARAYDQADDQGRLPEMGHVVRRWLENFLAIML